MNYCLDISAAPYGTGVSRYTTNLARALSSTIGFSDTFSLFGSSLRQFTQLKTIADSINADKKYLYLLPPRTTSVLFNQLNLPIDSFIGKQDLFHGWDWYLPRGINTKVVTTVHDLALFKFPNIAHPDIKKHHHQVMLRIKKNHTHVIAVSEATKKDLIELFDINPDQIKVIYEALPEESKIIPSTDDIAKVSLKYAINKPYLLMVGTLEPRKNYPRQILAWQQLKHDFDLVIVGKPGWEKIQPEPGLIQIGYASGNELASLYRGAQSLLYCSLAEGFGLPMLEAFFHQLPVITSNISSLSEISDGSAVKVDPNDIEAIVDGIKKSIDMKDSLIKKGTDRLKDFSWGNAAKETFSFYKKAIE